MASRQSLAFRLKKQVNDLLRRLTGYHFVKVDKLEALKAAAKGSTSSEALLRHRSPRARHESSARSSMREMTSDRAEARRASESGGPVRFTSVLNAHPPGPAAQRAYFEAALEQIREHSRVEAIYCVNSVPKSGSTFTTRVLQLATSGRIDYGGDFQMIEHSVGIGGLARALNGADGVVIFKGHMLAEYPTIAAMRLFDIRYVNIVRDLFDVMVSAHDHLLRTTKRGGVGLWPGLNVVGFEQWDEQKRYDYIAQFIMPWYFRFMQGWYRVDRESILRYEDMVTNPRDYFATMERRLGLKAGALDYERPAARRDVRFNVGVLGRGERLRERYEEIMRSHADFYEAFDYSLVGL